MPEESADSAAWVPDRARDLAAEVLGPAAMSVDASPRVPAAHLDLLAAEGFSGRAGPRASGGLEVEFPVACQIVEILAGACLSTTFVWMQHHSAVRAVAGSAAAGLREEMLAPLCRGQRRAGVALAGALPGPPRLRARAVPGGYLLDGTSPWVTGWGLIGTLYTAARDTRDTIIWALLDVPAAGTLSAEPAQMVAVTASSTVQLAFDRHFVPAGRVASTLPLAEWRRQDAAGLRLNGSLALGLAARCCGLIGPGPLDDQLAACRAGLDCAAADAMPAARAAACALAMRAAAALVVAEGSSAILAGHDAQRLAREALFLLVFGSRPAIRQSLSGLLIAGSPCCTRSSTGPPPVECGTWCCARSRPCTPRSTFTRRPASPGCLTGTGSPFPGSSCWPTAGCCPAADPASRARRAWTAWQLAPAWRGGPRAPSARAAWPACWPPRRARSCAVACSASGTGNTGPGPFRPRQ